MVVSAGLCCFVRPLGDGPFTCLFQVLEATAPLDWWSLPILKPPSYGPGLRLFISGPRFAPFPPLLRTQRSLVGCCPRGCRESDMTE